MHHNFQDAESFKEREVKDSVPLFIAGVSVMLLSHDSARSGC